MSRTLLGLLAAVGTAASALVGLAHGAMVGMAVGGAAVTAGALAYFTAPSKKILCRTRGF
jgi:hypothetical protein